MGIKAGSGSGRGSSKGGSRQGTEAGEPGKAPHIGRRKFTPIEPPTPTEPLQPIPDSPFPEKKAFRLGHYKIVEERDDYVICTGYDPNAKDPFAEITPDAFRTIKVAKPPLLQRTTWDGQTVTIDGVDYTYDYSDDEFGVRWATWNDDNGKPQAEEQRIDTPYIVDDLLIAVEIRKSAAVDGMVVADEDGARLRWIDLNSSGRKWKATYPRYAKLTSALSAASSFLTGETYASAVFVKADPASPGNLIADTHTFTVINRWVDLSLSSGKYLIVDRIGKELVIVASECP
jgi:hypothetical protein